MESFLCIKLGEKNKDTIEKSIQLNPDNYKTLNNLGIELINLKKLEEAKKIFISSTKLNPNCAETHYNLGKIYTKFKNYKIAEQKFKKAIYLKNNYDKK